MQCLTAVQASLHVTEDSSFSVFCNRGMQSTKEKRFPVELLTFTSHFSTSKRDLSRIELMIVPHRIAVAPLIWGSPWSM